MKYPNLKSIDDSRAPASTLRDVRMVCSRANCSAWFDSWRNSFVFGREKGSIVALFDMLVGATRGFDCVSGWTSRFGDRGVDGAVRYINWSKIDAKEKARMEEQFKKAREREAREELMKKAEAYRPEFRAMDKFRDKKLSMGRHYKGVVTVP